MRCMFHFGNFSVSGVHGATSESESGVMMVRINVGLKMDNVTLMLVG